MYSEALVADARAFVFTAMGVEAEYEMLNSRPKGVFKEVEAGERVRVLLIARPHEIRADRCVRVEQQTLGFGAQHVAVGGVRLRRVAHWDEELFGEEALDSLSRAH